MPGSESRKGEGSESTLGALDPTSALYRAMCKQLYWSPGTTLTLGIQLEEGLGSEVGTQVSEVSSSGCGIDDTWMFSVLGKMDLHAKQMTWNTKPIAAVFAVLTHVLLQ